MSAARNLPHGRPKVDRHSEAETGNTVPERRATIRIISGISGQSIGRPRKTGKNKWAEFLSGTPKTGLHTNEQGHSKASNGPRFLRQNGFLDCNPKAWLSGGR